MPLLWGAMMADPDPVERVIAYANRLGLGLSPSQVELIRGYFTGQTLTPSQRAEVVDVIAQVDQARSEEGNEPVQACDCEGWLQEGADGPWS